MTLTNARLRLSFGDLLLIGAVALALFVIAGPILLAGALVGGLILALSNAEAAIEARREAPALEAPSQRVLHSRHWEHPVA